MPTALASGTQPIVALTGTVEAGVEAGCLVLVDGDGRVQALLTGRPVADYPTATEVTVYGSFQPGMMTTCQQGTPFQVTEIGG